MDTDSGCKARKRVASRQLTRDDSESSDSDESPRVTFGSFQRASDEVLASRRIIRVRRGPSALAGPNPFSGVSLIAPASSQEAQIVNSSSARSDAKSQLHKIAQGGAHSCQLEALVHNGNTSESVGNALNGSKSEAGVSETSVEGTQVSEKQGTATSRQSGTGNHGKSHPRIETGSVEVEKNEGSVGSRISSGFASFSSTGSNVPTSFSSVGPAFTFGSQGTGAVVSTESHSFAPVFGRSGLCSFGSAVGVSSSAPIATNACSVVPLPEVHFETGEEKETVIFRADATLFEYSNKVWKERGKGDLKLNVSKEKKGFKPRLIMRARGNYRLLLNASLYPDIKVSKMDNRGVSILCANSAAEGKSALVMYGLRMKDSDVVADFLHTVESYKGDGTLEPDSRNSASSQRDQRSDETNAEAH